jgi:hypothetical protein
MNKLKCKQCNEEFRFKNNEFKSNETLFQLIESQSDLSDEETNLKQQLEISIRKFFEFYVEFIQNKSIIESDVFDHFQEIRFQVDEQRKELKKRIDDIALAMIDEIKKSEAIYFQELKETFPPFDYSKSLENELNETEELFRDPNLLIQTIKDMQHKQEESLNEIKFKLNEMNQVKDDIKETHFFVPNLSSFNPKETSLFGSIKLNQFTNINSLQSQILKDDRQSLELIHLCEFSLNDKWTLLYRGTRDGFGSDDFHSKCDGHCNTLTILKAKESSYIFGGFTTVSWDRSSGCKSDPNAFIFSLTNKDRKPVKIKVESNRHHRAIYCHSSCGSSFGGDICIANNANTTMDSFSNLGDCYKHPQYEYGTDEADTFLAGSHHFQLDEIEVYQKE